MALLDRLVTVAAAGRLDHAAWAAAFAEAAAALRDQVMAQAAELVEGAAREARLPGGQLRAQLPDAERGEALLNRLLACAMPLERLASEGGDLLSRRARGAALEAAWEAAVAVAVSALRSWQQRAAAIAAWRRPLAPVVASVGGLAIVLTVASAWLGGQLTPPEWFRPVHDAFWSLPWP
ncbi:MAG: hypothetical protein IPJ11_08095 [Gemmatimonadetes bacterium]|nr:hypothetical protein [Gemmatimonadota bacterium]